MLFWLVGSFFLRAWLVVRVPQDRDVRTAVGAGRRAAVPVPDGARDPVRRGAQRRVRPVLAAARRPRVCAARHPTPLGLRASEFDARPDDQTLEDPMAGEAGGGHGATMGVWIAVAIMIAGSIDLGHRPDRVDLVDVLGRRRPDGRWRHHGVLRRHHGLGDRVRTSAGTGSYRVLLTATPPRRLSQRASRAAAAGPRP